MTLDHLNIVVADLDRSVRFYRELFGLGVALDCRLAGDWFERVTGLPGAVADCVILQGAFRLELLKYLTPPGGAHGDVPAAVANGWEPPRWRLCGSSGLIKGLVVGDGASLSGHLASQQGRP